MPAVGQGDDALPDALAEGLLADDLRAPVVLKCARHDFRGGGGVAVDQDHHRQVEELRVSRSETLRDAARALVHDVALGQELVRDADALVQETAAVVAQVEHERGDALRPERVELLGELLVDALVGERADADVADVIGQYGRFDADDVDLAARHGEDDGLRFARAEEADPDLRAGGTAHEVDDLVRGEFLDVGAVHGREHVAAQHARLRGGTAPVDVHDLNDGVVRAVARLEHRADALERAAAILHLSGGLVRCGVACVRVL